MARMKPKVDASNPQPNNKVSSTRTSERPRPSVQSVEVSSETEEEPQNRGAERGLSKKNVIGASMAQQSIKQGDDEDDEPHSNRRMTRGSRKGRTDDRKNYDMKYHPIDEVTRPNWAVQRRPGSRSVSAPRFRADDGDTIDASVPSSAKRSNDEDSDKGDSDIEELPARRPDPRATRHSARAEANKGINYSRKYHPQDYALPGYQQKANQLRRAEEKRKRTGSKRPSSKMQSPFPRDVDNEEVIIDDSNEEEDELELDDQHQPKQPFKPRKKLRVLSDDRSPSPWKPIIDAYHSKAPNPADATKHSDLMLKTMSDGQTGAYVDGLLGGFGNHLGGSDEVEAAQNLNGMVDDAQVSSSSARGFSSLVTAKQARPIAGLNTFASDTEEDPQGVVEQIQSQYSYQPDGDCKESMLADDDGDHPASDGSGKNGTRDEDDGLGMQGDEEDESDMMFERQPEVDDANNVAKQTRRGDSDNLPQPSEHGLPGVAVSHECQAMVSLQTKTALDVPPDAARGGDGDEVPNDSGTTHSRGTSTLAVKANPRVESSSSNSKASSRVNSRHKSPLLRSDAEEQEQTQAESGLRSERHAQPHSHTFPPSQRQSSHGVNGTTPSGELRFFETPSSKLNSAERSGFKKKTNAGTEGLDGYVDHSRPFFVDSYPSAARAGAGQPVSPLASFGDGGPSKPTAHTSTHLQMQTRGLVAMNPNDGTGRSQITRESSRVSLQSLEPTPDRRNDVLPVSQQGQKDVLLSSENQSPVKEK